MMIVIILNMNILVLIDTWWNVNYYICMRCVEGAGF